MLELGSNGQPETSVQCRCILPMGDERDEIKKHRQEEVIRHICLGSAQGILEDSLAKLSQESITEANKFTENILSRENSFYMNLEKKEWHIQGATNIFG